MENTGHLRFVADLQRIADTTNELAAAYDSIETTMAKEMGGEPWKDFDDHFKAINEARALMLQSDAN